ncbi:MAG: 16S rRNA (guanine(966)-N(2))-methyltransferase RsmD [Anaerovoracaceae bacterium]
MRIIAGDYKGRRLYTPKNNDIRPTTDKVKEALFSILTNKIYKSVVLDLFSGTGNIGLEALSRGAKHCYFGDNQKASIMLIKENIEYCKAQEKSTVIPGDFRKILSQVNQKCDLIFLDPPYKKGLLEECFLIIEELDLLAEGGTIVAEHPRREDIPKIMGKYEQISERRYGKILLSIYS